MASWFVALPVEPSDWLERLPPPPEGTRLLAAADLHLTVAFLGDLGEARARAAWSEAPLPALEPFRARLTQIAAMGPARRPSAFAALAERASPAGAGSADSDRIDRSLTERLTPVRDALLEAAGLPAERREFRPHVTLARPQRRASLEARAQAGAWARSLELGGPVVKLARLALYTGDRHGVGPSPDEPSPRRPRPSGEKARRDSTLRRYRIVESRPLVSRA